MQDINNAKLSALSNYHTLVPDFLSLYRNNGSDLGQFYLAMKTLAVCGKEQRLMKLRESGPILNCQPETTMAVR
jgi:predicted aminopeptidase